MSNFWGKFFNVFGVKKNFFFWKHYSVRTKKLHKCLIYKKYFKIFFDPEKVKKNSFLKGLKIWV